MGEPQDDFFFFFFCEELLKKYKLIIIVMRNLSFVFVYGKTKKIYKCTMCTRKKIKNQCLIRYENEIDTKKKKKQAHKYIWYKFVNLNFWQWEGWLLKLKVSLKRWPLGRKGMFFNHWWVDRCGKNNMSASLAVKFCQPWTSRTTNFYWLKPLVKSLFRAGLLIFQILYIMNESCICYYVVWFCLHWFSLEYNEEISSTLSTFLLFLYDLVVNGFVHVHEFNSPLLFIEVECAKLIW